MKPRASLLVSTYNMPRHLELVFTALARQSTQEFEVIVCDDGSGPETAALIKNLSDQKGLQVTHVWHEHRGFRKCKILNQGLRKSVGEVLIFLDGDCVPHRNFIEDHLRLQEEGRYLAGRRVELGPVVSESLTPERVAQGFFDRPHPQLIASALQGETEFLNRSFRIPWESVRSLLKMDRVADLKGCNYSVNRRALIDELNGFDEEYEGYGREDTDVELRLQNAGYKIKSLKGLALQFHVWHERREFTPANETLLERVKTSGRVRCEKGYLPF